MQNFTAVYLSPRKRGICFHRRWFVCVCLSVTAITKKIVDGFAPNFMRRFLGGKRRPSSCFDIRSVDGCGSNDVKLAVLVYRCLHGLVPRYLSDYIQSATDSNRRRLRSSSSSQLVIRRTRLSTVGDRAFPVAGVTSAPTLTVFRNRLTTFLFSQSLPT